MPQNRVTFVVIRFVCFLSWMKFFNKTAICCNKMPSFNMIGFNKRNICSIVTKFAQYKI